MQKFKEMKNFIVMKNGTEHATLNAKNKKEAEEKVFAYYGEELQVEENLFYDLSEQDLKDSCEEDGLDFVITNYKIISS